MALEHARVRRIRQNLAAAGTGEMSSGGIVARKAPEGI